MRFSLEKKPIFWYNNLIKIKIKRMNQTRAEKTEKALREVVILLLDNCMLLSVEEKQNIGELIPLLNKNELTELFQLLLGSKRRTNNILEDLAAEYPAVMYDLDEYQKETLKTVFKDERDVLKISLNKTNES